MRRSMGCRVKREPAHRRVMGKKLRVINLGFRDTYFLKARILKPYKQYVAGKVFGIRN